MAEPNVGGRVLLVGRAGESTPVLEGRTGDRLEEAGFAVETARGSETGGRAVQQGRVDCVVAEYEAAAGDVLDGPLADEQLPVVLVGRRPHAEVPPGVIVGATAYLRRRDDGDHAADVVAVVERAVERARTSHDRRLVAEAGPACVVREGTVTYATPALADLLGRDRETLEGAPAADLADDDERDRLAADLRAAAAGEPVDAEFRADAGDDERVVLAARWRTVDRPGATVEGRPGAATDDRSEAATDDRSGAAPVVGSLTDVTGRVEREAELARDSEMLASLLENIPMSVYFKDRQARHERVSAHQMKTDPEEYIMNHEGKIHVHPEDVVGKTDFDLYAPGFAEVTVADDRRVMESEEAIVDLIEEGRTNRGEVQYTSTTKAPRYDEEGDAVGLVGITIDVTEREQHKRELQRQNERLEEFAEVLTHDLRNPLNIARGYLDLLAENHGPDFLEECDDALDRMEQLVEEIRAFVLQGRTVEEPEPVALDAVARDAWRNVDTGDGSLAVADDITFEADRDRLQRILENLYRNAVEHAGPDVAVTVGALEGDRGFYVADDGPGVPPDDRTRIFERGFTTTERGTGFGLAIVADIAEAHGWTIEVVDDPDGGARFEVTGVVRAASGIGQTIY